MDANPVTPNRSSNTPIVVAIIVAALVIAGAILFVFQQPDECEEWNDDLRVTVRRVISIRDAAPGSMSREEAEQILADARATMAEIPEECEIEEDTKDLIDADG